MFINKIEIIKVLRKSLILIPLFLFLAIDMYGQNLWHYTQPADLDDGWETAHLRSFDVDTSRIYQLFNQLQGDKHKVHSMILVKEGQLVIEEYFDDYDAAKQHDLRSVTKSITSILMGIAVDEGFIDNIDDPFTKYIQNPAPRKNKDNRKQNITLRHLITYSMN